MFNRKYEVVNNYVFKLNVHFVYSWQLFIINFQAYIILYTQCHDKTSTGLA